MSKIKFYKFVEANETYIAQEFVEEEHPRDGDGKFTDKGGSSEKTYESGEKILPEWKRLGYGSDKEYKASDYYKYNVLNK